METCFPQNPAACPSSDKMPTTLYCIPLCDFISSFVFLFMEKTAARQVDEIHGVHVSSTGPQNACALKYKLYFDNHLHSFTDYYYYYFKLGS